MRTDEGNPEFHSKYEGNFGAYNTVHLGFLEDTCQWRLSSILLPSAFVEYGLALRKGE